MHNVARQLPMEHILVLWAPLACHPMLRRVCIQHTWAHHMVRQCPLCMQLGRLAVTRWE